MSKDMHSGHAICLFITLCNRNRVTN